MKYGIFFLVISGGFLLYGYRLGGWYGLLFWPALAFGVVAAGYLGVGARIFRKRPDGTHSPIAGTILLPYLLFVSMVWQLSRLLRGEACWNEIAPGLILGRRADARDRRVCRADRRPGGPPVYLPADTRRDGPSGRTIPGARRDIRRSAQAGLCPLRGGTWTVGNARGRGPAEIRDGE